MQTMYRATFTPKQGWSGQLQPYGPLQLHPSAQVLNYGQSVFEGMKAQRTAGGNIVLFRPDENAARMMAGVTARQRSCMRALKHDCALVSCWHAHHTKASLPSLYSIVKSYMGICMPCTGITMQQVPHTSSASL